MILWVVAGTVVALLLLGAATDLYYRAGGRSARIDYVGLSRRRREFRRDRWSYLARTRRPRDRR